MTNPTEKAKEPETLRDAAEKYSDKNYSSTGTWSACNYGFIAGAEWQQQQYSSRGKDEWEILNEIHTMLAKTELKRDEYAPICSKIIQLKALLSNTQGDNHIPKNDKILDYSYVIERAKNMMREYSMLNNIDFSENQIDEIINKAFGS